jgi:uncharacterized membrane-anchored protein
VAVQTDSQATLALILGIVSIVCCGIAGPFAFFIGNSSLNRIRASGGTLGGETQAQAGRILGAIGTILLVLLVLLLIVRIATSVSTNP